MICLHLFSSLRWPQLCSREHSQFAQDSRNLSSRQSPSGKDLQCPQLRAVSTQQRVYTEMWVCWKDADHVCTPCANISNTATFTPNILAWEIVPEDTPIAWINTAMSPLTSSLLTSAHSQKLWWSVTSHSLPVGADLGFVRKGQILFCFGLDIFIRDCLEGGCALG